MRDVSFDKEYSVRKKRFDGIFAAFIDSLKDIPEPLISSMKYSLAGKGKRVRPMLFLASAETFGAEESDSLYKMACAIECIHAYSLIHDDLPCMDNADMRRGKPSNHKAFGENVAVLAGDALLNLVYETVFDAIVSCTDNERERYIRAGKVLADLSGSRGLIAGQVIDTIVEPDRHLSSYLNYVYQHKTADLICAALVAGATVGGADEADLKRMKDVGDNIGYVFQLVDDIIDADSGEDDGKETFVGLYGNKETQKAIGDRTAIALEQLAATKKNVSFLRSFVRRLSARKS